MAQTEFDAKLPGIIAKIEEDAKKKVSEQIDQLREAYKDKIEQLTTEAKNSSFDAACQKERAENFEQQLQMVRKARSADHLIYESFRRQIDTLVKSEKGHKTEEQALAEQLKTLQTDFSTTQKDVKDVLPRVETCEHRLNKLSAVFEAVDDLQKSVQTVTKQLESHQKTTDSRLVKLQDRQNATAALVQKFGDAEPKRLKQRSKNPVFEPVDSKEELPSHEPTSTTTSQNAVVPNSSPSPSPPSAASNPKQSAPPSPPTSPESDHGSAKNVPDACKHRTQQPADSNNVDANPAAPIKNELNQSKFANDNQGPTAPDSTPAMPPKKKVHRAGQKKRSRQSGLSEEQHPREPPLTATSPAKTPETAMSSPSPIPAAPSQTYNAPPAQPTSLDGRCGSARDASDAGKNMTQQPADSGNDKVSPVVPAKKGLDDSKFGDKAPIASQPTAATSTPAAESPKAPPKQTPEDIKREIMEASIIRNKIDQQIDELMKAPGGYLRTSNQLRPEALQLLRLKEPNRKWPAV